MSDRQSEDNFRATSDGEKVFAPRSAAIRVKAFAKCTPRFYRILRLR